MGCLLSITDGECDNIFHNFLENLIDPTNQNKDQA